MKRFILKRFEPWKRLLAACGERGRWLAGQSASVVRSLPVRMAEFRRNTANLLLPQICAGCQADIESETDVPLCQHCRGVFQLPAGPICVRCAAPAPAASIRETGCLHCESTSFRFHRIASLGVYEGQMQTFILRMKHLHHEALSLAAGRLLGQRVREIGWNPPPELITAVPMHWTRRLWRGVNSASLLAEMAAAELRLPTAMDLLATVRIVPRQSSLTPSRRRHNMRRAFAASRAYDIRDAHVLIIDDVLTTGTTANAAAQALRLAGAGTVSLAVVARGIGVG